MLVFELLESFDVHLMIEYKNMLDYYNKVHHNVLNKVSYFLLNLLLYQVLDLTLL